MDEYTIFGLDATDAIKARALQKRAEGSAAPTSDGFDLGEAKMKCVKGLYDDVTMANDTVIADEDFPAGDVLWNV